MTDKRTGISQRTYVRLAGFMYLFVLFIDLSGLPLLSKAGNWHVVGQCCLFLGSPQHHPPCYRPLRKPQAGEQKLGVHSSMLQTDRSCTRSAAR